MTARSWQSFWLQKAYLNASMSSCVSRQVGAVAHKDNRQIADGMNGTLSGMPNCNENGCERCNNPNRVSGEDLTRCKCCHAEVNIVAYCARVGISLAGASVTTTVQPCLDCLKILIASGVVEIFYAEAYLEADTDYTEWPIPITLVEMQE